MYEDLHDHHLDAPARPLACRCQKPIRDRMYFGKWWCRVCDRPIAELVRKVVNRLPADWGSETK